MVATIICSECGNEQISVFPVQCDYLECGQCHKMLEIPEEIFEAYENGEIED